MEINAKAIRWAILILFGISSSCHPSYASGPIGAHDLKELVYIHYDDNDPAIKFAAKDLEEILISINMEVQMSGFDEISNTRNTRRIIIAKRGDAVLELLNKERRKELESLGEQGYSIRISGKGKKRSYWAIGYDRIGAMYAGIAMGETIKAFGIDRISDEDNAPYILKRGLKFNIPLDQRSPSHDDRGTAAQSNIINMWDFTFWTEYLDILARQRYNVLSLWNKHPFPHMIKLDDYPDVALQDVYNEEGKVKDMTIEQKIALWKNIMDYAHDRGIEIYIITWNICMNGVVGKYGITEQKDNMITIDYQRKSVESLFLTYPKLAGIGVTAGENMMEMDPEEKEEWLWITYGKGVQDVRRTYPDRHIRFIHRFWWTEFEKIDSRFSQLKDGYDMSFKYARARMYSAYNPPFAEKELLPVIPETMATWWNIRNDDIYNLRWGDPEYVRQFILHLPKGSKTAGYYMGSDRYVWGRESISKNPATPRILENEKHWFSFLLWGRMGYDPKTPDNLLQGLINYRFPQIDSEKLLHAWRSASQIIPLVNRFHWYSWDYLWLPEACTSTGSGPAIDGYHNIHHFIHTPVMPESDLIPITEYVDAELNNKGSNGRKNPINVSESLELFAQQSLEIVQNIHPDGDNELRETIGDIEAMAHLGKYYAFKIKGATYYQLFIETKENMYKTKAISELEKSLASWSDYANILDKQYQKMNISMHGLFDWDKLKNDVKADIDIVKNTH